MPWKCPQCGTEVPDGSSACNSCPYVKVPLGIVIKSDATGKEIPVRVGAVLGSAVLKTLGDPEVKFVSAEQFKIEKRPDQGGWAVVNAALATNPMYLNGAPIDPAGAVLKDGDQLSVKDKHFRLTIHFLA